MWLNPYQIMWLVVFFDLPTAIKSDRKNYATFRKNLMKDGFFMLQFSVYLRHCASKENGEIHIKRIKKYLPPKGQISILRITDKQFEQIESFIGKKPIPPPVQPQQLEMF